MVARTGPLGLILDRSQPLEVPLGRPVDHVPARCRHRVHPHTVDQLAEEFRGVGLALEHGADHLDPGRLLVVAGRGQPQSGVQLVRPSGAQACQAWTTAAAAAGGQVSLRTPWRGCGEGAEDEGGDHAELAAAAAQRPEQLLVVVLVAVDDATVGQDDLRPEQVVAG